MPVVISTAPNLPPAIAEKIAAKLAERQAKERAELEIQCPGARVKADEQQVAGYVVAE